MLDQLVPNTVLHHTTLGSSVYEPLASPWGTLVHDVDGIEGMHPHALAAWGLLGRARLSQALLAGWCRHVHVYSDGGFREGCASWAFVVVLESWGGTFLTAGWAAAPVCTTPDAIDAFYAGAAEQTSHAGELSAIVWALAWLLGVVCEADRADHKCFEQLGVTVWYDSTEAGSAVLDVGHCAREERLLQQARALRVALGERCCAQGAHVKAHSGQPWNEFADSLCTFVLERCGGRVPHQVLGTTCSQTLARVQLALQSGAHEWLFVQHASPQKRQQYPRLCDDGATLSVHVVEASTAFEHSAERS